MMKISNDSRRAFIKKSLTGAAVFTAGGILPGFNAKSYANLFGANDRIKVGVMGVNSRGNALATNFALQKNCKVLYISYVDTRAADKCAANVEKNQGKRPKLAPDFRKALEDKDLDAMAIAKIGRAHV